MSTSVNILSGLGIPSQIPLNPKQNSASEAALKDLGLNNNLAFTYEKGLQVYCRLEGTRYEWREVESGEELTGLRDTDFIYPNGTITDGVDYSNKKYNFFPIITTLTPSEVYIEEGDNITITGTGVELDPFIINGLESPLNQIDEGNGNGIIIRDRIFTNYGNIGLNAVDFSYNDTISSTKGATGENSFSINKSNTSSGENSFSGGLNNISSGLNSFSFGENNESNNTNSISLGSNIISSGISTIGIGRGLTSKSFSEIALGSYNSNYTPISTSTWSATDRLFTIGNGFNEFNKSDALLIYKNGLALLPSVTNSLIENATGKAVVTREYLESILPTTVDGSETKLLEGTNITITGNGTTLTPYIISYTADDISQYTDEMARDAVGTILEDTNTITFNYDDVLETINANVNINGSSTSTGILSGGDLSIGTLNTLWTIQEGEGYIYNSLTNSTNHITWLTQEDNTATYLTTNISTYVLIDNTGTVIQQTTAPTQQQLRTHIYIGKLAHTTLSTILFTVTEPCRMFDIVGQIGDLNKAIGPVNVGGGNVINHNGSNLTISATAGGTYRPGANYLIDRNSPSITSEPQVSAPTFRRKYRTGTGGWNAVNATTIDPDRYDNNSGTLVTVPTGKFTVQVFWRFGNTGTIHVDYGQTYYDTLEQARASIGGAIVIQDPDNVRDAVKRGWLVVKQNTNVLNNTTDAIFIQADKFGERGATGAIPDLQSTYNNSSSPEILTNSVLGAFSLKRGSAADTDNVFEIINGAGSITSTIKGDGALTALTYNGFNPTTDLRTINTTSPLLGGGNLTADRTLSIQQSTSVQDGYLSSTDWNVFNNKQPAGAYITSLTGEVTASGAGAAVATLSTSAVTGKILTGLNITGGSISSADSILSAFGKVQNQINGVLGGSIFQTTWNASTNTPTLTSSVGTKGYYYIVDVAGSTNLDGITDWKVGDWAIYDGTVWRKVDNTDAVSSVNGFTGAVSLTTSNITEGTNLYYTEGRVSANTDVVANTAARHSAVTLGTTNGLSLSGQQISLGLSSTSTTGALSSTDWNTFNNKATDSLVVHLAGTETITGQKSFTNYIDSSIGVLFGNSAIVASSTLPSIGGRTNHFAFRSGNAGSFFGTFNTTGFTAQRDFVFPNTSGTIALTSDLTAYAPLASPTFTGTVTTPAIIVSGETASTIAHFDASKNIKSLPTATYPSLTELSYVKGVTSAIQTQIDSKAPSTGGTGYIQNQNASAQSANMWISGIGTFGDTQSGSVLRAYNSTLGSSSNISVGVGVSTSLNNSGFLVWQNDAVAANRYLSLETFSGANPIRILGSNFNITTAGAATFSSTVTASNGYFTNNVLSNTFGGLSGGDVNITTNTGGTADLIFQTANAERFRISGSTGNASFTGQVTASNGTLIGGTLTSGYLPKATGTNSLGNSLIYDNGTNVGIGTTEAAENKVRISNNLNTSAENWVLGLQNNNNETNLPTVGILFRVGDNNSAKGGILFKRSDGFGVGDMYFLNNNTIDSSLPTVSANTSMVIKSSGNLLINTTTDDGVNKLQVMGSARTAGRIIINPSDVTGAATSTLYQVNGTSVGIIGSDGAVFGGSSSNFGMFVYGNNDLELSTNSVKRIIAKGNGNVLIGTTTDDTVNKLQVNGGGKFTGIGINATPIGTGTSPNFVQFSNTGGDFYLGQEGSTSGGFFTGSTAYDNVFYTSGPLNFLVGVGSKMRIEATGNVLIGTTTDDGVNKLQVNGSVASGTVDIKETASRPDGIRITNRNATKQYAISVDESSVDDSILTFIDKTAGLPRLSVNTTGVVKINNLAGTGTRMVTADSSGNLGNASGATIDSPALTGTPTAPTATAGTNTTQIATTAFVQTQASGGNYTPTLTNTANITSSSLTNATYTRIGDIVTVNIGFSVDPTAANTNTVLTITLPIARTVSTVLNSGSGAIFQNNTRLPANFQTSGNTTQGVIYMYPSSTGTYGGSVTFQYNIN